MYCRYSSRIRTRTCIRIRINIRIQMRLNCMQRSGTKENQCKTFKGREDEVQPHLEVYPRLRSVSQLVCVDERYQRRLAMNSTASLALTSLTTLRLSAAKGAGAAATQI